MAIPGFNRFSGSVEMVAYEYLPPGVVFPAP